LYQKTAAKSAKLASKPWARLLNRGPFSMAAGGKTRRITVGFNPGNARGTGMKKGGARSDLPVIAGVNIRRKVDLVSRRGKERVYHKGGSTNGINGGKGVVKA